MKLSGETTLMSVRLSLPLLLLLLLVSGISGRRQLPEILRDRDTFCEACYATTTELYQVVKNTPDGSLEQRIDGALKQACSPDSLKRYAYPAELLTAGCRHVTEQFENDLGLGLMAAFQPGKKPRAAATVKDVCVTRMKACKKTSAIPSLRQNKEKSVASKSTSSSQSSAQDLPSSAPGGASAQAVDRETPRNGESGDGSSGAQTRTPAARKDEL